MFLFCHIPKTAGTSLRVAIEKDAKKIVLNDYGPQNQQTSKDILRLTYGQLKAKNTSLSDAAPSEQAPSNALHSLPDIEALKAHTAFGIYGHVPVRKYISVVVVDKVISFVREPISRIVSEYNHVVRNDGYQFDLLTFASQKRVVNSMGKFLNGAPWAMFGFIGLSEQYTESLALINQKYDLNLKELKENRAPVRKSICASDDEIIALTALNKDDIALYNHIAEQFEWRKKCAQPDSGLDFVHGAFKYNEQTDALNGFAYIPNTENVVLLEARYLGMYLCDVVANRNLPLGKRFNVKADGKVGFALPLKGKSINDISMHVKASGQPLPCFRF